MFKEIIKILDKSKAEGVDIFVARDMIANEDVDNKEYLNEAVDFIHRYYDTITKCRRLGDNDTIKALVEADDGGRKKIVKEVENRVEE